MASVLGERRGVGTLPGRPARETFTRPKTPPPEQCPGAGLSSNLPQLLPIHKPLYYLLKHPPIPCPATNIPRRPLGFLVLPFLTEAVVCVVEHLGHLLWVSLIQGQGRIEGSVPLLPHTPSLLLTGLFQASISMCPRWVILIHAYSREINLYF